MNVDRLVGLNAWSSHPASPKVAERLSIEFAMVHALCSHAFAQGYAVAVEDIEDGPVDWCYDWVSIFGQLCECDDDTLLFKHQSNGTQGYVTLVWGNGWDVICDYTTSIERLVESEAVRSLYNDITDCDDNGHPIECGGCTYIKANYLTTCPWCKATWDVDPEPGIKRLQGRIEYQFKHIVNVAGTDLWVQISNDEARGLIGSWEWEIVILPEDEDKAIRRLVPKGWVPNADNVQGWGEGCY